MEAVKCKAENIKQDDKNKWNSISFKIKMWMDSTILLKRKRKARRFSNLIKRQKSNPLLFARHLKQKDFTGGDFTGGKNKMVNVC